MHIGKQPREVAFGGEVAVLPDTKVEVMVLCSGQLSLDLRLLNTYPNTRDICANVIQHWNHVTA